MVSSITLAHDKNGVHGVCLTAQNGALFARQHNSFSFNLQLISVFY